MALIKDPRRAAIYERLGIPTIATVMWATERILLRILPDRPAVEWIDPTARVCLVERVVPSSWAGRPLSELDVAGVARVVALTRLGVAIIPQADTVAQDGDLIHAAVSGDHVETFDSHLADTGVGGH